MRVGQKNKLTYRWARKGSRPRTAHDQRTQSTYLFGAVCPEYGTGAALVLPFCNTEAMQLHLDEIAARVTATGWMGWAPPSGTRSYRLWLRSSCRRRASASRSLTMTSAELIPAAILKRKAVVYVR